MAVYLKHDRDAPRRNRSTVPRARAGWLIQLNLRALEKFSEYKTNFGRRASDGNPNLELNRNRA